MRISIDKQHVYMLVSEVQYIAICFISNGIAVPVLEAWPSFIERISLNQLNVTLINE